ncbi:MAG: hypothetical protein ABEJ35_05870 [Halobacteriaceae archaeon]
MQIAVDVRDRRAEALGLIANMADEGCEKRRGLRRTRLTIETIRNSGSELEGVGHPLALIADGPQLL